MIQKLVGAVGGGEGGDQVVVTRRPGLDCTTLVISVTEQLFCAYMTSVYAVL